MKKSKFRKNRRKMCREKKRPGGYSYATLNAQVPTMKEMHAREKNDVGVYICTKLKCC
jgi:hypothetical protein